MACSGPISSCFSKKTTELLKKAIVVLLIQIVGWFVYTYIEEGFPLTDCIFNHDNIKKIIAKKSNVNDTSAGIKLYFDISHILKGDLKPDKFEVYYDEFKNHFNVTPTVLTEVSIGEICRKWYLFTAITLTTVGKLTLDCVEWFIVDVGYDICIIIQFNHFLYSNNEYQ